ncbi:MAG: putative addiction module antidote protein [Alphaproteobacteria bacterium]|nr:putative addiction module antidote protein [Alphaproteobacteria bacterium]MCL2505232.1 putative addiction module antidote protein [Alphaproteobacteria bacterium]
MLKKGIKTSRWNILDYLTTEKEIAGYLEAALEEGDAAYFLDAVGTVAKARSINEMAKKMNVSRESLYKSFAKNKKPQFATVFKAIDALGLRLAVVPKDNSTHA